MPILTFNGTLPVESPHKAAAIGALSTYTMTSAIWASVVTTMRTLLPVNRCLDCRLTRLCTFSYSWEKEKTNKQRVIKRIPLVIGGI